MTLYRHPLLSQIFFLLILVAPLLFISPAAHAEITSMADAINKSGRQRMLTQRILSTYYQVGKKINLTTSTKQLAYAISLFESQLNELNEFARKDETVTLQREKEVDIEGALKKVSHLWFPVKNIVTQEVNRSLAEELRDRSEELLLASHDVVLLLQKLSNSESGRLVNISGRQRMLSQRLSSLYILKSWGFNDPKYDDAYRQAIVEYRSALDELKAASINTRKIDNFLITAEKYFKMFENSNSMLVSAPSMLRRSAEKMLWQMNTVTLLYQIESEKLQRTNLYPKL